MDFNQIRELIRGLSPTQEYVPDTIGIIDGIINQIEIFARPENRHQNQQRDLGRLIELLQGNDRYNAERMRHDTIRRRIESFKSSLISWHFTTEANTIIINEAAQKPAAKPAAPHPF